MNVRGNQMIEKKSIKSGTKDQEKDIGEGSDQKKPNKSESYKTKIH